MLALQIAISKQNPSLVLIYDLTYIRSRIYEYDLRPQTKIIQFYEKESEKKINTFDFFSFIHFILDFLGFKVPKCPATWYKNFLPSYLGKQ